jgi:uncharacterized protein YlxW (UPF0749 family)
VRRRSSFLLASVLAVAGFLIVTAAFSARDTRRAEEPRKAALIHEILDRRSQVDGLDQTVRQLRDEVLAAERDDASRSKAAQAEAERLAQLAAAAGTTSMKGPALVVRLSDSSRAPKAGTSDDVGAFQIHDTDLQLVVNALFASGAEAVAINDSRIVSTSPIRAAGATIVVNFRPLTPPYKITAIGADRDRFDATDIAKQFHTWTKRFGLGFSVSRTGGATVPAYTGQVPIDDAHPVGG